MLISSGFAVVMAEAPIKTAAEESNVAPGTYVPCFYPRKRAAIDRFFSRTHRRVVYAMLFEQRAETIAFAVTWQLVFTHVDGRE